MEERKEHINLMKRTRILEMDFLRKAAAVNFRRNNGTWCTEWSTAYNWNKEKERMQMYAVKKLLPDATH
jgi:hypothetical protein